MDGLLNIEISDDERDNQRAKRTGQNEQDFQAIRATYRPKVENGNIYKQISLPIKPGANKLHLQEVVHAAEELYFFKRFNEAIDFIDLVLHGESRPALDQDTIRLLTKYEGKCKEKLKIQC